MAIVALILRKLRAHGVSIARFARRRAVADWAIEDNAHRCASDLDAVNAGRFFGNAIIDCLPPTVEEAVVRCAIKREIGLG